MVSFSLPSLFSVVPIPPVDYLLLLLYRSYSGVINPLLTPLTSSLSRSPSTSVIITIKTLQITMDGRPLELYYQGGGGRAPPPHDGRPAPPLLGLTDLAEDAMHMESSPSAPSLLSTTR
jgi:hypothetical protein